MLGWAGGPLSICKRYVIPLDIYAALVVDTVTSHWLRLVKPD